MQQRIALIGFGEAGAAFASGAAWVAQARAYDDKSMIAAARSEKAADYDRAGVRGCDSAGEALDGAALIFSLVTADQALNVAAQAARHIVTDALFFDCNSVAPATKSDAARLIEGAGGRYVDVAVMSPVQPARRNTPLLVSGPHAAAGASSLRDLGFSRVEIVEGAVGAASSIKMIRSVMVKGLEALSAECVLAAEAAGVREAVVASLDASWTEQSWAARFDYNLDRMMIHGMRRAAEMEEVVKTLEALGTGADMTRGTVLRQQAIGELGLGAPEGLHAKLRILTGDRKEQAA